MRRHFPRFQPDAYAHNLQIVNAVKAVAEKHGVTPAQVYLR
jgi:pyridoxine 4-dehydrogenase